MATGLGSDYRENTCQQLEPAELIACWLFLLSLDNQRSNQRSNQPMKDSRIEGQIMSLMKQAGMIGVKNLGQDRWQFSYQETGGNPPDYPFVEKIGSTKKLPKVAERQLAGQNFQPEKREHTQCATTGYDFPCPVSMLEESFNAGWNQPTTDEKLDYKAKPGDKFADTEGPIPIGEIHTAVTRAAHIAKDAWAKLGYPAIKAKRFPGNNAEQVKFQGIGLMVRQLPDTDALYSISWGFYIV